MLHQLCSANNQPWSATMVHFSGNVLMCDVFLTMLRFFLKIIFLFIIGCCQLFILNQFTRLYVEKDIVIEFEINFVLNFLSWIRALNKNHFDTKAQRLAHVTINTWVYFLLWLFLFVIIVSFKDPVLTIMLSAHLLLFWLSR